MTRRKINPRLIKTRRSYTVEKLAQLLGCHKNSVRSWLRQGLEPLDTKRPLMIHGSAARKFLEAKRRSKKRRCRPDELYCFRCQTPRALADRRAIYSAKPGQAALLNGRCAECGTPMFKRVSAQSLPSLRTALDLEINEPEETPKLAG
jgi:hypothetical protein